MDLNIIYDNILSFIKPRPHIPIEVEKNIIYNIKKKLLPMTIKLYNEINNIEMVTAKIKKIYYSAIMQPGETIGIICGQCIGEKTTQSSLNNFHSAGLDTGTNSQIDNLQNIINASKSRKSENRFKISLYPINKINTVRELQLLTSNYLDEIKLSDLIININYKNIIIPENVLIFHNEMNKINEIKIAKLNLNLQKIFTYRITRECLLLKIPNSGCLPYSMLDEDSEILDLYIMYENNIFELLNEIKEINICGIQGVKNHYFDKNDSGWYINCFGNNLSIFFKYSHIYDIKKIISNSMYEIYQNFGILATQELILIKCKEIIPDIHESHFKILGVRMTRNGFLEPLTRYTMRSNNSPLSKASFEESFETFIKACKFNEIENFTSISSSVICGKKPKVGTYKFDVLVDYDFFINN